MKAVYAVRWLVQGKIKQREFPTESEARVFFTRLKGNNLAVQAQIIRATNYNWFTRIWDGEVRWLGRAARTKDVLTLLFSLFALALLWRATK